MSILPAWAAPYVGIPYLDKGRDHAGIDCWGIVRLVLAEQFGVVLPSYDGLYADGDDWAAIGAAVRAGLTDGWDPVTATHAGDLAILKIAKRPWHCAVMIGPLHFLHANPGDSVVVDRLDSARWARRLEGLYRHD